jgi:hypothetical protein
MKASVNVPARMSSTVEWLSSSRTTEGLPSGAPVAGSGRGLEVPAEIRWVGMNSRMPERPTHVLQLMSVRHVDLDVGWPVEARPSSWRAHSTSPP